MLKRVSVRNYLDKKISQDDLNTLKNIINAAPTARNLQSFSAIFISDEKIKNEVARLNWNQPHIAQAPLLIVFVADFNRCALSCGNDLESSKFNNDLFDKFFDGTVDAVIASTQVVDAAEAMGLSTCYVGGVKFYASQLAKMLHIEGYAIPVMALVVGYRNEAKLTEQKPKINKCYDENYDIDLLKNEIASYDEIMSAYYKRNNGKDILWSDLARKFAAADFKAARKKALKESFKIEV